MTLKLTTECERTAQSSHAPSTALDDRSSTLVVSYAALDSHHRAHTGKDPSYNSYHRSEMKQFYKKTKSKRKDRLWPPSRQSMSTSPEEESHRNSEEPISTHSPDTSSAHLVQADQPAITPAPYAQPSLHGDVLGLAPGNVRSPRPGDTPRIFNRISNISSVFGNGSVTNNNVAINIMRNVEEQERSIERITAALSERHVPGAVYDAQLNSGCMKGTREGIRAEIRAWINNPSAHQICWLTGKAGSGKTSIAKSVCEQASKDGEILLGGSFFCSRSTGLTAQRDIRCVVPTLTQLLAFKSSEFRLALAATIEPGDQYKEVAVQVTRLLRTPLSNLRDARVTILFVIDALDECGGDTTDGMLDDAKSHRIVTDMLEALVSLTRYDSKLPVKFLVTSRPEAQIRDTSISNDEHSQILRLHTVSSQEVDADIRLYITKTLDAKLSAKPQRRAMMTDSDIKDLVRLCDGLFIVAATAVEHVFSEGTDAAVSNFGLTIGPKFEEWAPQCLFTKFTTSCSRRISGSVVSLGFPK